MNIFPDLAWKMQDKKLEYVLKFLHFPKSFLNLYHQKIFANLCSLRISGMGHSISKGGKIFENVIHPLIIVKFL